MTRIRAALAAGLLGLAAASASAAPSFPPTQDGLVLQKDTRSSAVYIKPGASFAQYDEFVILDAFVQMVPHWMADQNELTPMSVTPEDVKRITTWVANEFKVRFTQTLEANDGFSVVTSGGPNVAVLRPAIIDLDITAPDTWDNPNMTSFVSSTGSATLLLEIYDSVSSTLLARIYNSEESGGDGNVEWAGGLSNERDAELMFDSWARMLRNALVKARTDAGETPYGRSVTPTATPAPAKQ